MAGKLTEITPASAANLTDLIEVTQDPSGTPVTKTETLQQVFDAAKVTTGIKRYTCRMQGSYPDPIVTVLENTLGGEIVWTGDSDWPIQFTGTLVGAFPDADKFHARPHYDQAYATWNPINRLDADSIKTSAFYEDSSTVIIEILVYP